MLARKEREFNDSLAKSRGVVDALSNTEIVTPGESVDVSTNVFIGRPSPGENGSNAGFAEDQAPRPDGWRVEQVQAEEERLTGPWLGFAVARRPDVASRFRATVPDNEQPTQPYWLAKPRVKDQFDWD